MVLINVSLVFVHLFYWFSINKIVETGQLNITTSWEETEKAEHNSPPALLFFIKYNDEDRSKFFSKNDMVLAKKQQTSPG